MKVGDMVRQKSCEELLIKIKSKKPLVNQTIGTVVEIHPGVFPKDWDVSDANMTLAMKLGDRVDVLWSNGKLTKNFAENSLEVVSENR